jgi:hypothetical protein
MLLCHLAEPTTSLSVRSSHSFLPFLSIKFCYCSCFAICVYVQFTVEVTQEQPSNITILFELEHLFS